MSTAGNPGAENADPRVGRALPPAGWFHDPSTAQTRWWDGTRWTEHSQPAYGPVFGTDPRQRAAPVKENGPAKASLILIVIQLLGGIALIGVGLALGATGAQLWHFLWIFAILSVVSFLMWLAAFALAIVGTVIAVRRPTHKREAVFALVFTSLVMVWLTAQMVVSVATYGAI